MEDKQRVCVERIQTPTIRISFGEKVFDVTEEQAKELYYALRNLVICGLDPTPVPLLPYPGIPDPPIVPLPYKPYEITWASDKTYIDPARCGPEEAR